MMGQVFLKNRRYFDEQAAFGAAHDIVSSVWEECKYNLLSIEDEEAFREEVMGRLLKVRKPKKGKFVSLDEPIPGMEGDIDRHSSGWSGYRAPSQEDFVFLSEMKSKISVLPAKQREALELLLEGMTLIEAAKKMKVSIHVAHSRVEIARLWLEAMNKGL